MDKHKRVLEALSKRGFCVVAAEGWPLLIVVAAHDATNVTQMVPERPVSRFKRV